MIFPVVQSVEDFSFLASSDIGLDSGDGGHGSQVSWISEQLVFLLFFDGLNSIFRGVLIFSNDISSGKGFNQMFAVLGDPSEVENKLPFDFTFGGEGSVSFDSERSQDNITFFITSIALNQESTILQ